MSELAQAEATMPIDARPAFSSIVATLQHYEENNPLVTLKNRKLETILHENWK